jgi:cobalamin biosynthesis protein CobD/CbiB
MQHTRRDVVVGMVAICIVVAVLVGAMLLSPALWHAAALVEGIFVVLCLVAGFGARFLAQHVRRRGTASPIMVVQVRVQQEEVDA